MLWKYPVVIRKYPRWKVRFCGWSWRNKERSIWQKYSHRGVLQKKIFRNIRQTTKENTCIGVFLGCSPASLFKRDSYISVSWDFYEIHQNSIFMKYLFTATSDWGKLLENYNYNKTFKIMILLGKIVSLGNNSTK